jgi:hypothetical protein
MKVLINGEHKRHFIGALVFLLLLFTAIPLYAAQATLAWDANNPTPDGYRLYQRLEGANYNYSAPVWTGSSTTCS